MADPSAAQGSSAQRRRAQVNIATVVVLLILVVAATFLLLRGGTTKVDAPAAGAADQSLTVGPPSAPHTVVVYEDFLCPYCGAFEKLTHERLEKLADEGTVYLDYRPFVLLDGLGDYSARATNALAVVQATTGDPAALAFHDLLFAHQPEEKGPYPDDDQLVAWAVEAGATESDVRPGIEAMAQQDWVDAATDGAHEAGVHSTPTVILDGTVLTGSVQDQADAVFEALGS